MRLRWLAILTLCAPAWPQPPAVIKTETKVVMVDVVATDKKGAYVHDLTAKDFRLWDDNKEQRIQSFALESAETAAASHTDYLVLAFDYAGMDAGDQLRARQTAAKFVDAIAGSNRRIAIASFDGGLRIVQGFTGNAGRLKDEIGGGKAGTVAPNDAKSETSATADLDVRERFAALKSLAADLSTAPGRKTIVVFSGTLTTRNDQKSLLNEAIDACNRANVAVYPVDVRDAAVPADIDTATAPAGGRGRFPGAVVSPGARGGRGAVTSLGGDSGTDSPTDDPTGSNQQVLFTLARGTGGFVIRNSSELAGGLQKIEQEQEEYYAIGFTPPESKEGACHTLRVKTVRSGITLRARNGYCDEKQAEFVAGNVTENDLAKRMSAPHAGNIPASLRLPFFYQSDGIARVEAVMEIQPEILNGGIKFEENNGRLHAELDVLAIAAALSGETAARFSDTMALDFDEADQSWKQKPLRYQKEFKIAPGQYNVTVAFSAGGQGGTISQPLTIDPYQPGQFAISGLAIGKELRKDGEANALPGASLFEDRTTLKINGVELIPTGSNAFAKGEQAFCYFEAYPANGGESAGQLTLQMRIVNIETNQPAWEGASAKVASPAGKTTIPFGVNVPIATLPAAAYQLQAVVTDAAGHSVQRAAGFEIK